MLRNRANVPLINDADAKRWFLSICYGKAAYRKLHLYLPADLGYILACKLMAGRPGKDYDDIRVLRQRLGIRTRAQAQALVNRFFPEPYDQELHQLADTLTAVFAGE